jgi:quercetin dioxygenase-like cupin family protein
MPKAQKPTSHRSNRPAGVRILGALLAIGAAVFLVNLTQATPPAGVISNVMLAQGATAMPLAEKINVGDAWMVHLEDKGQSEFYFQDFVLGPQGRSGWHTHPGLLLITVKDGRVDWYDKDCSKRTYGAGQSFTEGAEPHNVLNAGPGNAHLLIAYIVKKGEPRRSESQQPKCGEALAIQ